MEKKMFFLQVMIIQLYNTIQRTIEILCKKNYRIRERIYTEF